MLENKQGMIENHLQPPVWQCVQQRPSVETMGWKIIGEQGVHMTFKWYPTEYLLISEGKGGASAVISGRPHP